MCCVPNGIDLDPALAWFSFLSEADVSPPVTIFGSVFSYFTILRVNVLLCLFTFVLSVTLIPVSSASCPVEESNGRGDDIYSPVCLRYGDMSTLFMPSYRQSLLPTSCFKSPIPCALTPEPRPIGSVCCRKRKRKAEEKWNEANISNDLKERLCTSFPSTPALVLVPSSPCLDS